jgi:hypothetical protein
LRDSARRRHGHIELVLGRAEPDHSGLAAKRGLDRRDNRHRIGLDSDPVVFFDELAEQVAEAVPDYEVSTNSGRQPIAAVIRPFARRSDITPKAFNFEVVESPDGPEYRSGSPGAPRTWEELQTRLGIKPD